MAEEEKHAVGDSEKHEGDKETSSEDPMLEDDTDQEEDPEHDEDADEEEALPSYGKILIIDDVSMVRNTLRKILESGNYEVTDVASAQQALAKISNLKPDLILADIMMPLMNGIEFCKKLKDKPETANIPVVMCTAVGQKQYVLEAINAGAKDYIVKPLSRSVILEKVDNVLNIDRTRKNNNETSP